jgi:restriction system protein
MKFKMADKSLFAILLRSPWWVSMLVVALLVLVSAAVLPKPYVPFGVVSALPFLVISLVAAWRRLRAPDPNAVAAKLDQAAQMSWDDFSALLAGALQSQGYSVTRITQSGADFKLLKGEQSTLLSCRRWKASTHGIPPLSDLFTLGQSLNADRCVYLSLGASTDSAQRFAKAHQIRLISESDLGLLLLNKSNTQPFKL